MRAKWIDGRYSAEYLKYEKTTLGSICYESGGKYSATAFDGHRKTLDDRRKAMEHLENYLRTLASKLTEAVS